MTTREDAVDAVEKLVRYVESASGELRERAPGNNRGGVEGWVGSPECLKHVA